MSIYQIEYVFSSNRRITVKGLTPQAETQQLYASLRGLSCSDECLQNRVPPCILKEKIKGTHGRTGIERPLHGDFYAPSMHEYVEVNEGRLCRFRTSYHTGSLQ